LNVLMASVMSLFLIMQENGIFEHAYVKWHLCAL